MKQLNSNTGGPDEDFKFVTRGSLAYIGDWNAIYDRSGAESGPQTKATGSVPNMFTHGPCDVLTSRVILPLSIRRVAWLMWRSAYFSMAMSPRNMYVVPPLHSQVVED